MMYKVEQVANYFIERGLAENNPLNPMKLQKILYYSYSWFLALYDKKLFNENIQAWKYGPVVEKIYHDVKQYGNYPITAPISKYMIGKGGSMFSFKVSTPKLELKPESEEYNFLNAIWTVYSKYNAIQLSKSTHMEGTPWHQTAEKNNYALNNSIVIDDNIIKSFFLEEKKKMESDL